MNSVKEKKTSTPSLYLSQSYQDAWSDYCRSLKNSSFPVWDYIILTASNEHQARSFELQIQSRKEYLPAGTSFAVIPDEGGWEWVPAEQRYSWRVGYQNLRTRKESFVFTGMPPYRAKEKSTLHPHPHPQFVCRDRWILTTVFVPGERMSIALAPVEQFEKER